MQMLYDFKNYIDVQKFDFRIATLKEKKKIVELKEKREGRTLSQNAYLHVCIATYCIETGYTLKEAKSFLKRECGFMTYIKNGITFEKGSSKSDTKELTDFIEWIRNHAGMKGIFIASPDDYRRNWVEIEKEIESHKHYL